MANASEQIIQCSNFIDSLFKGGLDDRGLVSQGVSGHLRNLVEGIIVACGSGPEQHFDYQQIGVCIGVLKARSEYRHLIRFHELLQKSFSHYTLDPDGSERLMLKYVEFLIFVRNLCSEKLGLEILPNLEKFKLNTDPALAEYQDAIAGAIERLPHVPMDGKRQADRYYVDRIRPFFVNWKTYYEVTFRNATDFTAKTDRLIAFTNLDVGSQYSRKFWLRQVTIKVVGCELPITLIEDYSISIRPTELTKLGMILDDDAKRITANSIEYLNLSRLLTRTGLSLLDIVEQDDSSFSFYMAQLSEGAKTNYISNTLGRARTFIKSDLQGTNLLRYLLVNLNNRVLKKQIAQGGEKKMYGGLNASSQCYPFEKMPFASSLRNHNVSLLDLFRSVPVDGREHELLNRRLRNLIQQKGSVYVKVEDLASEGLDRVESLRELEPLVDRFNSQLGGSHASRKMILDKGQIFIKEYEDTVSEIIKRLQKLQTPIQNHREQAEQWMAAQGIETAIEAPVKLDDDHKAQILPKMFETSRVAVLYGAAGTGKTTMVNLVSQLYSNQRKLFLAHTNPAVDNLKRKLVNDSGSEFRTIKRHCRMRENVTYDLLVIDECSTVDNRSILEVLDTTRFNKLLLVGDNYQLESIEFGNWFGVASSYMNTSSVFELTTPFRSTDKHLLNLWGSVRALGDDIDEVLTKGGYSKPLDSRFFDGIEEVGNDEITLCLNYDGLYGINNINRFMQSVRSGKSVVWNSTSYKVGDPVLFSDSTRFKGLIFNNLKGTIVDFHESEDHIEFDIDIDRGEEDIVGNCTQDAKHLGGTKVRFLITRLDEEDDDAEDPRNAVPFNVAYAVSIHKAQGLEYESVRLVITSDNEHRVTHNVFYTAITRARKNLEIYWSPEAQRRIVSSFLRTEDRKSLGLLKSRQKI